MREDWITLEVHSLRAPLRVRTTTLDLGRGRATTCTVTSFYLAVAAIFASNTALLGFLTWAYHSPRFAHLRISHRPGIKVAWRKRLVTMTVISVLSLAIVLGGTFGLYDLIVHDASTPPWRIVLEALAILVLYDFAYYFLHRTLHHKKLMRFVHGVHHRARNPSALESFYLHPVELTLGLGLLLASTVIIGPVHPIAFLVAFFAYSNLNIVIHAGLEFRGVLRPVGFLIRKHYVHHDNFAKNYSSLTPLPDLVFGTAG